MDTSICAVEFPILYCTFQSNTRKASLFMSQAITGAVCANSVKALEALRLSLLMELNYESRPSSNLMTIGGSSAFLFWVKNIVMLTPIVYRYAMLRGIAIRTARLSKLSSPPIF